MKHTTKPDVDNFAKQALDICNGIVWKDDAQVVDLRALETLRGQGREGVHEDHHRRAGKQAVSDDRPKGYLTLGRRWGESIVLQQEGEEDIEIVVRRGNEGTVDVRVSVSASRKVKILRKELVG